MRASARVDRIMMFFSKIWKNIRDSQLMALVFQKIVYVRSLSISITLVVMDKRERLPFHKTPDGKRFETIVSATPDEIRARSAQANIASPAIYKLFYEIYRINAASTKDVVIEHWSNKMFDEIRRRTGITIDSIRNHLGRSSWLYGVDELNRIFSEIAGDSRLYSPGYTLTRITNQTRLRAFFDSLTPATFVFVSAPQAAASTVAIASTTRPNTSRTTTTGSTVITTTRPQQQPTAVATTITTTVVSQQQPQQQLSSNLHRYTGPRDVYSLPFVNDWNLTKLTTDRETAVGGSKLLKYDKLPITIIFKAFMCGANYASAGTAFTPRVYSEIVNILLTKTERDVILETYNSRSFDDENGVEVDFKTMLFEMFGYGAYERQGSSLRAIANDPKWITNYMAIDVTQPKALVNIEIVCEVLRKRTGTISMGLVTPHEYVRKTVSETVPMSQQALEMSASLINAKENERQLAAALKDSSKNLVGAIQALKLLSTKLSPTELSQSIDQTDELSTILQSFGTMTISGFSGTLTVAEVIEEKMSQLTTIGEQHIKLLQSANSSGSSQTADAVAQTLAREPQPPSSVDELSSILESLNLGNIGAPTNADVVAASAIVVAASTGNLSSPPRQIQEPIEHFNAQPVPGIRVDPSEESIEHFNAQHVPWIHVDPNGDQQPGSVVVVESVTTEPQQNAATTNAVSPPPPPPPPMPQGGVPAAVVAVVNTQPLALANTTITQTQDAAKTTIATTESSGGAVTLADILAKKMQQISGQFDQNANIVSPDDDSEAAVNQLDDFKRQLNTDLAKLPHTSIFFETIKQTIDDTLDNSTEADDMFRVFSIEIRKQMTLKLFNTTFTGAATPFAISFISNLNTTLAADVAKHTLPANDTFAGIVVLYNHLEQESDTKRRTDEQNKILYRENSKNRMATALQVDNGSASSFTEIVLEWTMATSAAVVLDQLLSDVSGVVAVFTTALHTRLFSHAFIKKYDIEPSDIDTLVLYIMMARLYKHIDRLITVIPSKMLGGKLDDITAYQALYDWREAAVDTSHIKKKFRSTITSEGRRPLVIVQGDPLKKNVDGPDNLLKNIVMRAKQYFAKHFELLSACLVRGNIANVLVNIIALERKLLSSIHNTIFNSGYIAKESEFDETGTAMTWESFKTMKKPPNWTTFETTTIKSKGVDTFFNDVRFQFEKLKTRYDAICDQKKAPTTQDDFSLITSPLKASSAFFSAFSATRRRTSHHTALSVQFLCAFCKQEARFECSACHKVYYCGETCRDLHWTTRHKHECRR